MSNEKSELRDAIDSELRRVQIQNHPHFAAWYSTLKPHGREIIDFVLEQDVTPDLILLAQDAPEEEWDEFQFLRVIGGGNPNPVVQAALTNFSLRDILTSIKEYGNPEE